MCWTSTYNLKFSSYWQSQECCFAWYSYLPISIRWSCWIKDHPHKLVQNYSHHFSYEQNKTTINTRFFHNRITFFWHYTQKPEHNTIDNYFTSKQHIKLVSQMHTHELQVFFFWKISKYWYVVFNFGALSLANALCNPYYVPTFLFLQLEVWEKHSKVELLHEWLDIQVNLKRYGKHESVQIPNSPLLFTGIQLLLKEGLPNIRR